jgi:hypothetical protein
LTKEQRQEATTKLRARGFRGFDLAKFDPTHTTRTIVEGFDLSFPVDTYRSGRSIHDFVPIEQVMFAAEQRLSVFKLINNINPADYNKYLPGDEIAGLSMEMSLLYDHDTEQHSIVGLARYKELRKNYLKSRNTKADFNQADSLELITLANNITAQLDPLTSFNFDSTAERVEIESILSKVEAAHDSITNIQNKTLNRASQFIGTYLGLPQAVVDTLASEDSYGQIVAALKQKYDLSQIDVLRESGASNFDKMRKQVGALFAITENQTELADIILDESNTRLTEKLGTSYSLLGYDSAEAATADIQDVVTYLRAYQQTASEAGVSMASVLRKVGEHYIFTSANLAASIMGVGDSVKKAAGSMLNPFEFDAVVQTIGYGGTSLIGEAYNTLIPLLDSLTIQTATLTSHASSSTFKALLDTAIQAEPEDSDLGRAMAKLLDSSALEKRYAGTVGLLANMQQIVRDALKPKEGAGTLLELFNKEIVIAGENKPVTFKHVLSDFFESLGSPTSHNKAMATYVGDFVRAEMGPFIAKRDDGTGSFLPNERSSHFGYEVRGFGALLMLSTFAKAESKDLASIFLNDFGLKDYYESWLEDRNISHKVKPLEQFITDYIGSALIRTQAEFATSNLEKNVELVYNPLLRMLTSIKEGNVDGYSETEQQKYIDLYDRFTALTTDRTPTHKEKVQLVAESIVASLEARRADHGILGHNMLMFLRASAMATNSLNKLEDNDLLDKVEDRYSVANALVLRQAAAAMMRGKSDMSQIMYMASNKLSIITRIAADYEVSDTLNGRQAAEKELGVQIRSMLEPLGFQPGELNALTNFLMTKDNQGQYTNLKALTDSSAAFAATTKHLQEASSIQARGANASHQELNQLDKLNAMLRLVVTEDGSGGVAGFNVDPLVELNSLFDQSGALITLFEGMSKRLDVEYKASLDDHRLIMKHSAGAEAVGVFAAPLLFALAGTKMPTDERVALFAFDVFQGYTEILNRVESTQHLVANTAPSVQTNKVADSFRFARLRQALRSDGIVMGAITGFSQEMLYRGVAEGANQLIQATIGERVRKNPKVGNVVATMGAEILSTVVAQGFARAVFKRRGSPYEQPATMDMLLIMDQIVDQAWRAAEYAQEQAIGNVYVSDAEYALNLDIEMTAILSDIESNIETGLLTVSELGGDSLDDVTIKDSRFQNAVVIADYT